MVLSYFANVIESTIMTFPDNNEDDNVSLRDELTVKFVDYTGYPMPLSEMILLSANSRSVNSLTSLLDAYAMNGYFAVVNKEFFNIRGVPWAEPTNCVLLFLTSVA